MSLSDLSFWTAKESQEPLNKLQWFGTIKHPVDNNYFCLSAVYFWI